MGQFSAGFYRILILIQEVKEEIQNGTKDKYCPNTKQSLYREAIA
jgi:hypothetical protein